MRPKTLYVYILASRSGTLYIGVTNDLARRINEHKQGLVPGFTSKYRIHHLAYVEEFNRADEAIAREKQLKGWVRRKKIALIESANPQWADLSAAWVERQDRSLRSEPVKKLPLWPTLALPGHVPGMSDWC